MVVNLPLEPPAECAKPAISALDHALARQFYPDASPVHPASGALHTEMVRPVPRVEYFENGALPLNHIGRRDVVVLALPPVDRAHGRRTGRVMQHDQVLGMHLLIVVGGREPNQAIDGHGSHCATVVRSSFFIECGYRHGPCDAVGKQTAALLKGDHSRARRRPE